MTRIENPHGVVADLLAMMTPNNNLNGVHHQRRQPATSLPRSAHLHPFLFVRCLPQRLLLLALPAPRLHRPPRRRHLSRRPPRPQAQEAPVRSPARLHVAVQYLLVAPIEPPLRRPVSPPEGIPRPAAYLSLNISLLFLSDNPNKVGIRYDSTSESAALVVMYRGVPLGMATVTGFEQPAHSHRLVHTRVVVDRFNVLQADALNIVRDSAINDRVDLRLTGDVAAKIPPPRIQVSVDCSIVISPRKQSLAYKQRGVDRFNF